MLDTTSGTDFDPGADAGDENNENNGWRATPLVASPRSAAFLESIGAS